MTKRRNNPHKQAGSGRHTGRGNRQRSRGARTAQPPHTGPEPAAAGSGARRTAVHRSGPRSWRALPRALFDGLIHTRELDEPSWKLAPLVLALAFAVRAMVALTGDFVLHPDEIMQYLEPAHRLAFGNGVIYWEYFYGARSWLVPGVVAALLKLFDLAGLGEPHWYVGGVKLLLN